MNKDIARLRELLQKATPGELRVQPQGEPYLYRTNSVNIGFTVHDYEVLAALFNAAPSLLAAVEDAQRLSAIVRLMVDDNNWYAADTYGREPPHQLGGHQDAVKYLDGKTQ